MVPTANKRVFISSSNVKPAAQENARLARDMVPAPASLVPSSQGEGPGPSYFSPFRCQPQPRLEFAPKHRALILSQVFLPSSYFPC